MTSEQIVVPNHHAHYPHFTGVAGYLAAISMIGGRAGNARLAAQLCGLESGDVVVDIGCGPGAAARYAVRAGAAVTGVDPARAMLRVARLITRPGSVRYLDGSAEHLPVADGSATVVWTIASVHHWSDLGAGLNEVRRVLRSGGRFVAIENHTQPGASGLASHGWTQDQAMTFAELCERHGLTSPKIDTHTGGRRPSISVTAIST